MTDTAWLSNGRRRHKANQN